MRKTKITLNSARGYTNSDYSMVLNTSYRQANLNKDEHRRSFLFQEGTDIYDPALSVEFVCKKTPAVNS